MVKIIGHGAYAKVYEARQVPSGRAVAVKMVSKLEGEEGVAQRQAVIREIAIMRHLEGHPAMAALLEAFESRGSYYLAMELCTGGELFDQIISGGHLSERAAAGLTRSLLGFVAFAHSRGVMHRDLKPENIMISDSSGSGALKVIDFGTSEFCTEGMRLSQKFGTPYYVAPEVLQRDYDSRADIWSVGVILYILLCGYPPFGGKTDDRVLQKVQRGSYSFAAKEWEGVSEAAKEVITLMLTLDASERPGARQLLSHPWLSDTPPAAAGGVGAGDAQAATALGQHIVCRLRAFAGMSRMQRLALVCLARTMSEADVARLRALFVAMDADNDGLVGASELQRALQQVGAATDPAEMTQLMSASDLDGRGQIDYEEFIAAMMDSSRVARRKGAVRRSFQQLDVDGDGLITVQDLARLLQEKGDASMRGPNGRARSFDMAATIVEEVDRCRKGALDFEDFQRVWSQT